MDEPKELVAEIAAIKERNRRVEADKAWERSGFRIFSITAITYIIASFVMYAIGIANYLLSALIPTIGYFLSTQSLPVIKRWWIKHFFNKQ
jgi:hypothetical protein